MVRSIGLVLVCLLWVGCPKEESEPQCNQADGTGFGLRVDFQGRVDGEGGTATGGASMFVAPAAAVTVPLSVREQFEVSPSSLTFTPENWDVPQTVTVRAKPGVRSEGLDRRVGVLGRS